MFRAPAKLILATFLLLCIGPPAYSQYMYLDSNGDGVHTEADVLDSTGITTVDVWLATDRTRDGVTAICATEPELGFTVNSYEVILHSDGGTVQFGSFQNLQTTMDVGFGHASDSTDLYAGYGAGIKYPPGRYLLGRVTVVPTSGSPALEIAPHSSMSTIYGTSFGSECSGVDYDNTLKLGSDWFDVDGLRPIGSPPETPNHGPVIQSIQDVVMNEGESVDRTIVAEDPDGDDLTLEIMSPLWCLTLGATVAAPGHLEVPVHIAPDFIDAGSGWFLFRISDGTNRTPGGIRVTVANVNRSPTIDAIADQTVEWGTARELGITVRDPDNSLVVTRLSSAPAFVTYQARTPAWWEPQGIYGGTLRIAPTEGDVGHWTVALEADDRITTSTLSFSVDVPASSSQRAPVMDSIPDFALRQGQEFFFDFRATDADGYAMVTLANAPWWFRVWPAGWWESDSSQHWALSGQVPKDVLGSWSISATASDGVLSVSRSFQVTVVDSEFAPEFGGWQWGCAAQGEVRSYLQRATDPDGNLQSMSVGPVPSWVTATQVEPFLWKFTLAPTSDDQPQSVQIPLRAVDAIGLELQSSFEAEVTVSGGCYTGGGFAGEPTHRPPATPDAGGSYAGVAGAPVRLNGSGTLNAGERQFRWSFGDGAAGLGQAMNHTYREGGTYEAVLCVFDRYDSTSVCDTAFVTIRDALAAHATQPADETPIALRVEGPPIGFRLERVGEEYSIQDVVPGSLYLWSAGHGDLDSIPVDPSVASAAISESGTAELVVPFARQELRKLFSDVRGRRAVSARIQGRLSNGARVRAPIDVAVVSLPGHAPVVWPNPMNPRGSISFEVRTPGRATARLFDVQGRLVRTVFDGVVGPGEVQADMDGRDSRGRLLGSGVYYYEVHAPGASWRGRVTILR